MKIYLLIIIFLIGGNNCFPENYAILISGDRDTEKTSLPKTYMYGDESCEEFWHDAFLMWETLYKLGFKDENIFVFYEDGTDETIQTLRYNLSRYPEITGGIVDYNANRLTILGFLEDMQYGDNGAPGLTENDFLFVWTFGHGGSSEGESYLTVRDGAITESEFSSRLNILSFDKRVFWMQQCFSGGFIDDLSGANTVLITACEPDEGAYRADDIDPDGADSNENEFWGVVSYNHGEFNYHSLNAVNLETIVYNSLSDPDQNSDGKASIQEIYDWADSTESSKTQHTIGTHTFGPQHPQIDDDGNNANSVFIDVDPPTVTISGSVVNHHPKISWTAPPDIQDIDEYEIWRYRTVSGGGYTLRATVTGTTYTDNGIAVNKIPPFNRVYYKVKVVDYSGNKSGYSNEKWFYDGSTSKPIATSDESTNLPIKFSLIQNYPNPFNPVTKIKFDLPEESQVNLLVYNSRGQIVATLLNDHLEAGRYTMDFNATQLPSGIYFYRISAGGFTDVKRMILIK